MKIFRIILLSLSIGFIVTSAIIGYEMISDKAEKQQFINSIFGDLNRRAGMQIYDYNEMTRGEVKGLNLSVVTLNRVNENHYTETLYSLTLPTDRTFEGLDTESMLRMIGSNFLDSALVSEPESDIQNILKSKEPGYSSGPYYINHNDVLSTRITVKPFMKANIEFYVDKNFRNYRITLLSKTTTIKALNYFAFISILSFSLLFIIRVIQKKKSNTTTA